MNTELSKRLMACFAKVDSKVLRKIKVTFEDATRIKDKNKVIDTIKMLPFTDSVTEDGGSLIVTITTDRSNVGISEMITNAVSKVASNITYNITELED